MSWKLYFVGEEDEMSSWVIIIKRIKSQFWIRVIRQYTFTSLISKRILREGAAVGVRHLYGTSFYQDEEHLREL